MSEHSALSTPVMTAAGLSIGYGRKSVVTGIGFELAAGSTLALVGANGSGKSTLLKTIAGLLPALSGSIRVFGKNPGSSPARVAYLSQIHSNEIVLPLRAIDIVRMARFSSIGLLGRASKADERIVRESMERMEVTALANEPLSALSGGQRQRVFLAQALARDAELFLLDEPETNLDAEGRERYRAAVRVSKARGGVVVTATHDIKEASQCDWAMLLAQRVVAFGPGCSVLTPEALLSTFGITARMEGERVVVVEREHGHDCND